MSISFDLNDLVAFRALSDLGSFRKAAETVHLSQPAFSRRIEKLERSLGIDLVERTTRRVTLTAAGREFEGKVRSLLDDLDAVVLSIRGEPGTRGGRVVLACVPTVVRHIASQALARFQENYPLVQVALMDVKANEVCSAVSRGDADMGVCFVGANDADIEFTTLFKERYVLACRRDHPLAQRHSMNWTELDGQPIIAVARTSSNRLIVEQTLALGGVRPRIAYEVQTGATALCLVEAGLGVATVPSLSIADYDNLIGVPLALPEVTRTIGLIRRRGRVLSTSAAHLYELLRDTEWLTQS